MATVSDLDMEGLIDVLSERIRYQFSDEVSQIYFDDPGVMPPKAFQNNRGEWRAVVMVNPAYDRLDTKTRTGFAETRFLGVNVCVLVNMIPFFEALPVEAYGGRMLARLTTRIREYLAQDENRTLGGKVIDTHVGDVDWDFTQRKDLTIRGARIQYQADTYLIKMPNNT